MSIFWNNTIQVLGISTDDHKILSLSCWMLHVRGHVVTTYIHVFHICLNLGLLERSGFRWSCQEEVDWTCRRLLWSRDWWAHHCSRQVQLWLENVWQGNMFCTVLAMIFIQWTCWTCHQFIKLSDKLFLHDDNFTADAHILILGIVFDNSPNTNPS